MHPYVPHLLEDINKAHRPEGFKSTQKKPTKFEEEMEEMEDWVSGKDEDIQQTFSYYCGLKTEDFPPVEQLTKEEIKLICRAFRKMMWTWNLGADFPKRYPVELDYPLLINTLNEKAFIPCDGGFLTFDYCSGSAPECIFKEYCSCLQYWKDDK